jgi:hypothetical protein
MTIITARAHDSDATPNTLRNAALEIALTSGAAGVPQLGQEPELEEEPKPTATLLQHKAAANFVKAMALGMAWS